MFERPGSKGFVSDRKFEGCRVTLDIVSFFAWGFEMGVAARANRGF